MTSTNPLPLPDPCAPRLHRRSGLTLLAALCAACSAAGSDTLPAGTGGSTPFPGGGGAPSSSTGGAPVGTSTGGGFSMPVPTATVVPPDAGVVPREECGRITAVVRDFKEAHPDMERALAFDLLDPSTWFAQGLKGIVNASLQNRFPVYAATGPTSQTAGPLEYYQWYVDTPGVNERFEIPIDLAEVSPGEFVFDSVAFFPIDGRGFGNEGHPHNYHFTTEVRTEFTYRGGEVFTFRGDDDLWMFVNEHLVIDLGGLHGPQEATVRMDDVAATAQIQVGDTYPMDIFHAERHTSESNFRIQTNIDCFVPVEPPPPPPPPVIR